MALDGLFNNKFASKFFKRECKWLKKRVNLVSEKDLNYLINQYLTPFSITRPTDNIYFYLASTHFCF